MTVPTPAPQPPRVLSVDAFRGFVMLLMMDGALNIPRVARQHFPDDPVWQTLAFHTDHVLWTGCSLHDLIQPAFSFLVGVSLPYSIANREARGDTFGWMLFHAIVRGLLLMGLGIFLRSTDSPITNWTFMDTLTQIGMGYVFLFMIGYARSQLLAWIAVGIILFGYWAAFMLYPLPFDADSLKAIGRSPEPGRFEGSMAHWNKNANLASDFDYWFLNQFPRAKYEKGKVVDNPFVYERSGYTTLNFIPTLATMILGLIAGMWLRADWSGGTKVTAFLIAGGLGLALGEASEWLGICPVVKIIWTPAWVLYSAGWTFLFLAAFYLMIDLMGFWHWAFPLFVIGANSIVAYCAYHWAIRKFISDNYKIHLGSDLFKFLGEEYEPIMQGTFVIVTIWLVLFWMYRNKIFVRI
jgi:heparan-alpha-glucosaminide N-acetyltransferase